MRRTASVAKTRTVHRDAPSAPYTLLLNEPASIAGSCGCANLHVSPVVLSRILITIDLTGMFAASSPGRTVVGAHVATVVSGGLKGQKQK